MAVGIMSPDMLSQRLTVPSVLTDAVSASAHVAPSEAVMVPLNTPCSSKVNRPVSYM